MGMIDVLAGIYLDEGVHMRELSRRIKLSLPAVKKQVDKMSMEGLIIKKREGRNTKLYLNRKNSSLSPYLNQVEHMRLKKLPAAVSSAVLGLLAAMDKKPLVVAIFGSYARGTYTKSSDIDIFFVFGELDKTIEQKARMISSRYSLKIEPVYLTWEIFRKKFFDEKDAFMNEVKRNKIIVHGIDYWEMLENEKA